MDEGGYVLDYLTPPGTSLDETDRILKTVEQHIAAMPETAAVSRRTGAELGLYATQQNKGDVLVKMKPRSERQRSTQEVMDDVRGWLAKSVPGIDVEFTQILQDMLGDLQGSPEPVEVKIFGNDLTQLEQVADQLGPKLQAVKGLVDYKGIQKGNPEIVFQVDPTAAGRAGLTSDQVTQQVSAGLLGSEETQLREADRTIGIRVRFPDSFRQNYDSSRQNPHPPHLDDHSGHSVRPVSVGAGTGRGRRTAEAAGPGSDRRPAAFHLHRPAGDASFLFDPRKPL
jgi:Cu/Ag efflux pump CusA